MRRKFRIRNVRRRSYTVLEMTVSARKAEKLFAAAAERGLHARVIGGDRVFSFSEKLCRHWWIPAICAAALAAAVWCGGFCDTLEIIGNEEISEFELCALLEDHGISLPMRRSAIDRETLLNLLYREYPQLAFAEVRFSGTRLLIQLQEGKKLPKLLSKEPCTVAAKKRGVILSVTVGEGRAAVSPGEIVDAGDPLILGAYQKKDLAFLVHARGKVLAQVDYFGQAELPLKSGSIRTGNTAEATELCLGRLRICLSGENPFPEWEEERRTKYTVPENMPAFLRIETVTYYECRRGISAQMRSLAETRLREQSYFAALKQLPEEAKPTDFSSVITEKNGILYATATVTAVEDIGMSVPTEPIHITKETGAA